jgi:hypothetical protein
MRDQGRATLARLGVERGWRECAENEGAALARSSDRPAELLAEEALVKCESWERLLRLAFDNGAYPYHSGFTSRDDMVSLAKLKSRDGALARISMWRAGSPMSASGGGDTFRTPDTAASTVSVEASPAADAPRPSVAAAEASPQEGEGETIVVTASRRWGCRVRLADRTLTERELEASAKRWAANATPLRVVRPPGAGYDCLAKIVWSLSKHGVTLFHFVEPSDAR